MALKKSKITKTATVMSGVLLALTACSNEDTTINQNTDSYEEDYVEDDTYSADYVEDDDDYIDDDDNWDLDLSYLQDDYPNLDLNSVEQYVETNMDEDDYDEDEMISLLDELEDTGQPTYSSYGSSFPWWLFLATSHYNYNSARSSHGVKSNVNSLTSSGSKNTSKNSVPSSNNSTSKSSSISSGSPSTSNGSVSTNNNSTSKSSVSTGNQSTTNGSTSTSNNSSSISSESTSTSSSSSSSSSYKSGFGSSSSSSSFGG